jgi:SagB-type dehydrogenase family enzyme
MRKTGCIIVLIIIILFLLWYLFLRTETKGEKSMKPENKIVLPTPSFESKVSVEQALLNRRSVREYTPDSLTLKEISQILWSAQGITSDWGARTAPSAGALFPLEVYLVAGKVKELTVGIYHYDCKNHSLQQIKEGDLRKELSSAALGQKQVFEAPANLVITAIYERTTKKYRERGNQYVHMEVGACAENVYLQCEALNLGTVFIGAFSDEEVQKVLDTKEIPLAILPIGKLKK